MSNALVRWTILGVFWAVAGGEVVYKWEKMRILPQMGLNNWRATSFALAGEKVFLSLVDVGKQVSGNGVVGAFNMSSSMSPEVSIFPFQNFYKINDPDRGRITTPMALRTDECERLWLLDSAVQNISGLQVKTNPAIYVFNTNTSQLVRSFQIPASQWTATTFFINFLVDTDSAAHDCEESYGYFADFNRFHLLTYDFLRNKSELKSHPFFSPDPLVHTPNGILFNEEHQDLNGIYGLALAEDHNGSEDFLYFHPLAATHEFRINTRVLKSEGSVNYFDVGLFKDKGENAAAGASVYDPETDMIFFAEVNTRKIGGVKLEQGSDPKLNTYFRYDPKLQSGHIVDLSVRQSKLWVLVDDDSYVTIHRLPLADIDAEFHRSQRTQQRPQTASSAGHSLLALGLFPLAILFSLCHSS